MVSTNELAWAAGIIDGEGTVDYYVGKKGVSPRVEVSMTHEPTVRRLHTILGGNFRGPYSRGRNKSIWVWSTSAFKMVIQIIRLLRPYLFTKRSDAARTLAFCHWRQQQPPWPPSRKVCT